MEWFIRKCISDVSSCPCRARTIRMHFTQGVAPLCFALPWARFLLPLWGVHLQSHSHADVFSRQQGQYNRDVHRQSHSRSELEKCKKRRKKPWKSVNFLCFIPWKSVKKRRKKPWKSVICRSLCPVYKQNIAIYIITRTITDVHGRHGELLYDSSCVSYFR